MSGFKGKINLNGRPKGSLNATSKQTKELLQIIVSKELKKMGLLLGKLEPVERIDCLIRLLPYLLPKQSEIKAEITTTESLTPEQREARIKALHAKMNSND